MYPVSVKSETGPRFPKVELTANRKTRCEACTLIVSPQFAWCELPCPRAGTWACGRWNLCIWCGAMRCDPAPVMQKTQALQPCICDFPNGERGWLLAQAAIATRWTRSNRRL